MRQAVSRLSPAQQSLAGPVDYVECAGVGYRWCEKGQKPLFAFGNGLSCISFACRNPLVTGGKSLSITFGIVNTGRPAGADVPQFHVAREGSSAPIRLAGFQRVTLRPGEARRVALIAEPRVVADYDTKLPGWRIRGGRYRVALARDARDRLMVFTAVLNAATMKP